MTTESTDMTIDGSVRICYVLSQGVVAADVLENAVDRLESPYGDLSVTPRREGYGQTVYSIRVGSRDDIPMVFGEALTPDAGDPRVPATPSIVLRASADSIQPYEGTTRVEGLLEFAIRLYDILDPRPTYVYGLDVGHAEAIGSFFGRPADPAELTDDRISDTSWLMVFPPDLVDSYGRDFLLAAPAWRSNEREDGSIVIVSWADPTDIEAIDANRNVIRDYFDIDPPEP